MTRNPREILNEFVQGMGEVGNTYPKATTAFMSFAGAAVEKGAMDVKTKELISVAVGIYSRCEYCIVYHTYNALKAGATADEIIEAGIVAGSIGGGPSVAYTATLLKQCIDEFSKDFL